MIEITDPLEEQRTWDPLRRHPTVPTPAWKPMGKDHREQFLLQLSRACRLCRNCELGTREAERQLSGAVIARDPHVFSNQADSRFMIVGQNPGWDELAAGEPFVGAAGKNFEKAIRQHGLTRKDFYITNNVKCFTTGNARPSVRHQQACSPWLRLEIAAVRPVLVTTLGGSAFDVFCPELRFGDYVGRVVDSKEFGVKVFAAYHPSPLNSANLEEFGRQMGLLCRTVIRYRAERSDGKRP